MISNKYFLKNSEVIEMFGTRELDAKNNYKPNLDDINESAKKNLW